MKNIKIFALAFLGFMLFQQLSAQSCKAEFKTYAATYSVGDTIQFNNTSTYGSSIRPNYYWSFGNGNGSTSFAPSYTYTKAGVYSVCLQIIDSLNNCASTYCDSIVIKGRTIGCNADFSTNSTGAGCTFKFKNKSTMATNAYWTFGDGNISTYWSPSHKYFRDGWYIVTLVVSDSSRSCSSRITDSVYARGCDSSTAKCNVQFSHRRDSSDTCKTVFSAYSNISSSLNNVTWSFGDGNYASGVNASHKYANSGWYVVSVYNLDSASNCSASYTDSIYVNACGTSTKCRITLAGQVYTGSNFAQSGVVYLIQKSRNMLSAVDTTYLDSMGGYYFNGVCKGDYFIKAALDKTDINFNDYMPTYYGNELRWDSVSATSVSLNNYDFDINLIKGYNVGGPGFISGDVTKGANKKDGEPIENIQVMVFDKNMQPSSYAYSTTNGTFELPNLAIGKYLLIVDVPGVKSLGVWIELTEAQPKVKNVEIKINEDQITTNVEIRARQNIEWALYPNPAANELFVQSPLNKVSYIEIVDVFGKKILWTNVNNTTTVNVSAIEPGTYILRAFAKNGSEVLGQRMFIKN